MSAVMGPQAFRGLLDAMMRPDTTFGHTKSSDMELQEWAEQRSVELGYLGGWIEAFHKFNPGEWETILNDCPGDRSANNMARLKSEGRFGV